MHNPNVSVVLPVRNGVHLLKVAVESIFSQEGVDFELIVVDDGSSDNTSVYLAGISDPRLRVVRREGGGLVAALNAGIGAAAGRYVARMDADDVALPKRLATQAAIFDSEPGADISFSSAYIIDGSGKRISCLEAAPVPREERRAILLGGKGWAPIIHPSVMMRRSMIEALGGYRESPAAEDHDLWLRAIDRYGFRAIPEPLLEYRVHDGGVSRTRAVDQSISNLMNTACYHIAAERGVDLYVDAPELYAELRSWAVDSFLPLLADIATARRVRSCFKRGGLIEAAFSLLRFLPRRPYLLRLSAIQSSMRRCHLVAKQHGLGLVDARAIGKPTDPGR